MNMKKWNNENNKWIITNNEQCVMKWNNVDNESEIMK